MSNQDLKNVAYVGFFRHFLCVFVFVVVFVIVFVFVFVSSYYFWIAFIISFQNMYGYRGLWSLRAVIMIIFEVMTDTHTDRQTPIPLLDSAHPVGLAEWKRARNFELLRQVPESAFLRSVFCNFINIDMNQTLKLSYLEKGNTELAGNPHLWTQRRQGKGLTFRNIADRKEKSVSNPKI